MIKAADSPDSIRSKGADAGSSWLAQLNLEYASRDGRTHLCRKTQRGPLTIQKSLYPEGAAVCHTLMLHPPSGMVANDILDIAVTLNAGSHVLITMPGAGKWYRSCGPAAMQRVSIGVAANAALEWLPPETIVYNEANAKMHTRIDLAAGGSYLGWEILCLGRTASGESFDSGKIRQSTEVAVAGELIWNEQCQLHGGSPLLGSAVGLCNAPVSAVMLAAGKSVARELVAQCRSVNVEGAARSGITAMPNLFVVRYVGHSSEQAKNYFIALWRLLRPLFTGRTAVLPRIWNT